MNALDKALNTMLVRWAKGFKAQSFSGMDIAFLPSVIQRTQWALEEFEAMRDGGYEAVQKIRDEREADEELEIALWEIENFANTESSGEASE